MLSRRIVFVDWRFLSLDVILCLFLSECYLSGIVKFVLRVW